MHTLHSNIATLVRLGFSGLLEQLQDCHIVPRCTYAWRPLACLPILMTFAFSNVYKDWPAQCRLALQVNHNLAMLWLILLTRMSMNSARMIGTIISLGQPQHVTVAEAEQRRKERTRNAQRLAAATLTRTRKLCREESEPLRLGRLLHATMPGLRCASKLARPSSL